MAEDIRPPGKTTIAPEVLLAIASLTATGVEGVSRMSAKPGGFNRLLRRGHQNNGVHVEVLEDTVNAELFLVLEKNVNLREVSHNVQKEVSRAITEMVGMQVGRIDIHIDDVDYDQESNT
ncbi:MAG: Asp23/Gls24 family envelope stress response protein [Anaerolineae bacterium]|nr:Asp23/Gls24 family envelope stress response protein [Anaerolineae bacterium]